MNVAASPKSPSTPVALTPEERELARGRLREHLLRHQLRFTEQRLAIFEATLDQLGHFTAEELLDRARERDRTVSRATVYRTLPIMVESHLVREVDVGKDHKFYQVIGSRAVEQAEVICLDCDRITAMDAPFLGWYARGAAQKLGLVPESQRLQVHSRCARFQKTGSCPEIVGKGGARETA